MIRISQHRWFASALIMLTVSLLCTLSCSTNSMPTTTHATPIPTTPITLTTTPGRSPLPTIPPHSDLKPLQLSNDPYTNGTSQHRTEVEPDTYSYGSTIVAAFQAGRFRDIGSSNIGWATSTDGGTTWRNGFLPGTTIYANPPGPWARITDPTVTYDAVHNTWLIATVAFLATPAGLTAPAVLVSLSIDGGITWSNPLAVMNAGSNGELDKDWIACDDTATSAFYGHCYVEWDDHNRNNLIQMSSSIDGGRTWGAAKATADGAIGLGAQVLVQPSGTVVVTMINANQTAIMVFTSTNGGASWNRAITVTSATSYSKNAYFRDNILLTAAVDGSGKVYLVWVDCRFETNCNGNDLVMTSSINDNTWSPVRRIPIASVGSGIDYYVSGLGADSATAGGTTHLGLAFYYYAASCLSNCQLFVGFVSSTNGGASWNTKMQLAGPIPASWVAAGNNKVGDYISTSFSGGKAFPVFTIGSAPTGGYLNEAMYTMEGGL